MPTAPRSHLSGLLVVDKPLAWTSMDVVRRVRRAAGGAKTGHAGTLDPLATGVLVCCLGRATKFAERVMQMPKVYQAEIDLSAFTATDDREGDRLPVEVAHAPARCAVENALGRFVGVVDQKPPAYSAVHIEGQRAYKLARRGQIPQLESRKVQIDRIQLLDYAWPLVSVRIDCRKGTYIRSIARDLGQILITGGHLASLRRLSIGPYTLSDAIGSERLCRPITAADLIEPPGEMSVEGRRSKVE